MKTVAALTLKIMFTVLLLAACSRQPDDDAFATQVAANFFATETAVASAATDTPTPVPTATATPTASFTPTPTVMPTSTPTPTPTAVPTDTPTITPTPEPDLSAVALTSADFPPCFLELPPQFFDFTAGSGVDQFFDSVFAFACQDPLEILFGFLNILSTEFERNIYDQQMGDTDLLVQQFASGFAAGEDVTILEQSELPVPEDIGDVSTGLTVVVDNPDADLRMDMILTRLDEVGVMLMSMYPDGQEPSMDLVAAARLVAERISDEFGLEPVAAGPTPPPTISATTQAREIDGMVQVWIPAGEFLMGSAAGGEDDERPQHAVYLDAFWIDRTEVTNAMFARFVAQTDHQTDAETQGGGWIAAGTFDDDASWRNPFGSGSDIAGLDDHPVLQVSWNDAAAYCDWADARLPTEAEWEKAARGTDGLIYPWGDHATGLGNLVNFADRNLVQAHADESADDGFELTAPAGSYPAGASPYGALDMSGNVWEWVADWYDESYYEDSPSENPPGPPSGEMRVLRGGSYFQRIVNVRAAERIRDEPDQRSTYVGFRCARSA